MFSSINKIDCGTKYLVPQPFSCDKNTTLRILAEDDKSAIFVGLLTRAFRGGDPSDPSQPSQRNSSDRFSPKERNLGPYSGGTVRDSHPVILFSIPGFYAGYATKWVLCCCHCDYSPRNMRCQVKNGKTGGGKIPSPALVNVSSRRTCPGSKTTGQNNTGTKKDTRIFRRSR